MATPPEPAAQLRAARLLARLGAVVLGAGAVAWAASVVPLFRQQAPIVAVAQKVVEGEKFSLPSLQNLAHAAEAASNVPGCSPGAAHALTLLRVAIINESTAAKQRPPEGAYAALNDASRQALSCEPADPFVWLTLFWLDVVERGFSERSAAYLRMSYALGPNESWIALGRNRLAFAMFEKLPKDLSDDAVGEFIRLLDTGLLFREAATTFQNAPREARSRILERLKDAKPLSQRGLASALHQDGIDVAIPGMRPEEARPWR